MRSKGTGRDEAFAHAVLQAGSLLDDDLPHCTELRHFTIADKTSTAPN